MEHAKQLELELEQEQQLEQLLKKLELVDFYQLPETFQAHFEGKQSNLCCLEDFAIYFLAALRQHTELHFRGNNESETPKQHTPVHQAKPTPIDQELNESPLSQLSTCNVSTPVRQVTPLQQQGRRSTGGTPQSSERSTNRSGGGGSSSFCLADFMTNTTPNQSQQRAKKKATPLDKSQRPRRRVLPMTISRNVSASSSFGDTSSFSNENNLLRLSQSCELDRSQGAELEQEARKMLLLRRQEIKSEAPVEQEREQRERDVQPKVMSISLEHVRHAKQLHLLAAIYALLMDLNLVPNVLTEISYALQLLNVCDVAGDSSKLEPPLALLAGHKECIYFAAKLLEQQKDVLLQLDRSSLAVLLQHDRLSLLSKQLQEQLEQQQSQRARIQLPAETPSKAQQNVHYQHEKDARDKFPSQQEFGAFKSQRDLFYKSLKQWEQLHLNRLFSFGRELGPLVRDIFKQSEHVVNMAHFAGLFVSQLLMSSREKHESPEELGLKLDQQRLNRLAQRLVTSNSSVEDQFPRTQGFFRDFIGECSSLAFLVQLQLALYVQLLRHNDSSFELLSLQPDGEEEEEQVASPYIVRPQAQAELLILAKFLGYVCAFPYNRSPNAANSCPQEQLQLRRQFQPPFEMRLHLERAMRQGKLLITLPWLVQYLVMLDPVTLQLPAALDTLELLYALYAGIAKTHIPLQPRAVFIARSCLGWLLESQPALSTGYYSHRRRMSTKPDAATAALVADCLRSLCFSDGGKVGSLLEQMLPLACPFLHEFRVAIAPSQRHVQRNGRYRYITTRLEQLGGGGGKNDSTPDNESQFVPASDQRKLVDAFLHSQNASMRRLLEFVTERSFKCVVKDAQQTILLPSKSAADAQVNGIESTQQHEVLRELQRIYQQARNQAYQQWTERVPGMLEQRIEQSLRALLPANTNDVVRHTYAHLIRQQAQMQLQQWLEISVLQSSFYHGDLQELATKVCRANSRSGVQSSANSNDLCLTAAGELSLSQILHELQQWVHCLSMRPEFLPNLGDLLPLLKRTRQAALLPHLPSHFYQLLGSILVRLLQLLMCQQPQMLTQPVISISCEVWLAPKVRSGGDDEDVPHPIYLEALLSVSFFQDLSANPARFQLLHQLLHHMLEAHVLDVEQLNQFFVALFKENWTQPVWSALSQLLHQLSQGCSNKVNDDDGKSQLFMEMLADLSSDLDSF
ncbi:protein disks lost [Drosophila virilis]|uniref:protein disks lost n=1 Tax=Drosophila virilis TaxID=7244 RepID=UPI001396444E|nr:protein disks lost [Drosophila virilis]